MKKFLAVFLAFLMVFGMVVPAFAEGTTVTIKETLEATFENEDTIETIKRKIEETKKVTLVKTTDGEDLEQDVEITKWDTSKVKPGVAGTYDVTGTYKEPVGEGWEGLDLPPLVYKVIIKEKPVADKVTIEPIPTVEALYSDSKEEIEKNLPKQITLKYKDNTYKVDVTWITLTLIPHRTGSVTLKGVYEKPDELDVDESMLPIANVKVEIGKPIIKEISFGGVKDSYDFENNKTDVQIEKEIKKIITENSKDLYILYDGAVKDIKVPLNPLEVKLEIEDFLTGVPGEYDATLTVKVHGAYDFAEGVTPEKKIKINVLSNIVELEKLGYKLNGKDVEIELTKNPKTQRQDTIYRVVLPKDTATIPTVFYKLSEKSEDAEVVEFVQGKLFPGDKGFKAFDNEARIRIKSKDGSYEALYKVIFTRETDPLKDGRVSGSDRIETSIEMSKKFFLKADTVIIASASNEAYVDALASAPLADLEYAPILLNPVGSLNAKVKAEIERLGAKNVIVVGGENSLSPAVVSGLSGYSVKRVFGEDRYLTSIALAKEVFEISDSNRKVVLVDGTNYPDALASSVYANTQGIPILLTSPKTLQKDVKNYLTEIKNEVVTIVGGPNSVDPKVVEELEAIESTDKVDRIKGDDRYNTAIEVAKKTYTNPKAILFADANGFADALVAGAVTNKIGAPIILTHKNTINSDVKAYVTENKTAVQIIVGGPNSITEAVQKTLLGLK